MKKLKKSVKAILISLCLVVLLAGSIVGVILASRGKPDGSSNPSISTPGGGNNPPISGEGGTGDSSSSTVLCNLTDAQKLLANKVNQPASKVETAVVYEQNKYLNEDETVIDKSLIYESYDNYFVSRSGKNTTIFLRVENASKIYYKDVFSFVDTQNIVYKEFVDIFDNYVALRYVYSVESTYNLVNCILDISDINDVKVEYETEVLNIAYENNIPNNDSIISIQKEYYLVATDNYTDSYNIKFFTYSSNVAVKEFSVYSAKLSNFYVDDCYYLFNQTNEYYFGKFDNGEFVEYTLELEDVSRFTAFGGFVFFEFAELVEHEEEKTENTINNANYSYSLFNFENGELGEYKLTEGYNKAYFNQSITGYIEVFEERYVNDEKTLGLFTYFDTEFNAIISYNADSISQKLIYSSNGNFLTNNGILTTENSINAKYIVKFNTTDFNYSLASTKVNKDTFLVFDNNASWKIMDMNGSFVFENNFAHMPYSYDDGFYVVDNYVQRFVIDSSNKTQKLISNFSTENHFFANGAGYYFVDNEESGFSLLNYKGELIYSDVETFDFSVSNGKTYLKITRDNDDVIYYIYNKPVNLSSEQNGGEIPGQEFEGAEPYGSQSGSGTGYSYTYTYGLGDDKSEYSFYITCSSGYYCTGGNFTAGRNATYNEGYVAFSETAITDYSNHDSAPYIISNAPDGEYYLLYSIIIGGNLKSFQDSEELIGTPSISCSKISMSIGYSNTNTFSIYYTSASYGDVGLNMSRYGNPTTTGYTFSSWSENSGYVSDDNGDQLFDFYPTSKGSSVTFTANWSGNVYKISYSLDGGTHGTYHPDSLTFAPAGGANDANISNPTKLGYRFAGWTISGMSSDCTHYWGGADRGTVTSSSGVTSDSGFLNLHSTTNATVYFTAKWNANTYTINYSLNGGTHGTYHPTSMTYAPEGGTYDKTISNPTKLGYTFTGWNISGMCDKARHCWGGYAHTGTTASKIKNETGWLNLTSVHGGVVYFVATWSANTYTVKYTLNYGTSGSKAPTTGRTYDKAFEVSNPTKLGYTFTGWTLSGMTSDCTHYRGTSESGCTTSFTGATLTTKVTSTWFKNLRSTSGKVTFTANWTANTYDIKFDMNNPNSVTNDITSMATISDVAYNRTVSSSYDNAITTIPVKTGYLFKYWSISGMTDDCTHYAAVESSNIASGGFTGKTLDAKNSSGTRYLYFQNLRSKSGEVTFKANWEPIEYNLTYSPNSGTFDTDVNNPSTATYDKSFNVTSPIRVGYDFAGWKITVVDTGTNRIASIAKAYPNRTTNSFINETTTNGYTVNFQALWEKAVYKVAFKYNNPTKSDTTASFSYDTWHNVPNPTRMGYTFAYWEISGMCKNCTHYQNTTNSNSGRKSFTGASISDITKTYFYNLHCVTNSTVTFTAYWTTKTYNVVIADGYGAKLNPSSGFKYDTAFSISQPTSTPFGYHFYAWKVTGMNATDELTSENVTHYYGKDTSNFSQSVATTTLTTPKVTTTNYSFKNLSSNLNATVTITPVWEENFYNIEFDLNNPNIVTNDISAPSSLYDFSVTPQYNKAFKVNDPTKSGYSFTGWSLRGMSDDCTHYYGSNSSTSTSFSSNNGRYVDPANPNIYVVLKYQYFKNLRSDNNGSTKAVFIANWKANTYTITYHFLPQNFDVTAFATSELNTKVNLTTKMTQTISVSITYDKKYVAINSKEEDGKVNFGIPVGMRFIIWGISSSNLTSATVTGKYNSSSAIVSAFSDSIYPNEERMFGPGIDSSVTVNWKYYSSNIHLYAAYDLAGISLRYFGPTSASGCNYLNNYTNLSGLNTSIKYTEYLTYSNASSIVNRDKLVGWMISADYFATGQLTERSVTIYTYNGANYVAYKGVSAYWGFKNTDAYSDEEPTYFLYAVYSDTYSGNYESLSFSYLSSTNSYEVVGRNSGISSVKIPTYYNDGTHGYLLVTSIGDNAFKSYTNLATVNMPNTITQIKSYAFYDNKFSAITLSNKLQSIGGYAFYSTNLTSITLPSTMKYMNGEYTFAACTGMTSISMNTGLQTIGYATFDGCNNLVNPTIPATVHTIGAAAFWRCYKITTITIPARVSVLGSSTFYYCTGLQSITFASNSALLTVGANAFNNCSALTSISLPDSVKTIDAYAFDNCTKLATVKMPYSLTTLGNYAFRNCSVLTSIAIPQKLTSIGQYAFYNCAKLATVNFFSEQTSSVGTYAFSGTALTRVNYYGTSSQWSAITIGTGNDKLKNAARYYL